MVAVVLHVTPSVPPTLLRWRNAAGVIVGDLSELAQMRASPNRPTLGSFDAVIHNAGIWAERANVTPDGCADPGGQRAHAC